MRISDWSSDVCSSDLQFLRDRRGVIPIVPFPLLQIFDGVEYRDVDRVRVTTRSFKTLLQLHNLARQLAFGHHRGRKPAICPFYDVIHGLGDQRSEEHTSELQSLMRISYAVFCLKKKKHTTH